MRRLLFGKKMCSACQEIKDVYDEKGIDYEYYDIDTIEGLSEFSFYNFKGIPAVVEIGDDCVVSEEKEYSVLKQELNLNW